MGFVRQASAAALLVTMTLWLQSAGMAVLIDWAKARIGQGVQGMGHWRTSALMVRSTTMVIVLHLLQILLWATFYRWHCLPTWESCFYFSAASYSTVGYGDIVLPRLWRSLGPVESVVGVLMSGVSVSALFAIVTRLISSEKHSPTTTKSPYAAIPFATCFRSTDYSVCGLHAAEFVSQTRRRSSPLSRKKWKTDENATFESLNKVYPRLESRGLWSPGLAMRLVGTAAGLVITALMIMAGADAFGQNDPLVSSTQPALPGGHTPFSMATAQDSIRMGN